MENLTNKGNKTRKNNKNNYSRYAIATKGSANGANYNISKVVLGQLGNSTIRTENVLNIINNAINHSNKIYRKLQRGLTQDEEYQYIYNKIEPIGITEYITHPVTGKVHEIYGYPRKYEGDTLFGCRGTRKIKRGNRREYNILHNDYKRCISAPDLNRVSFKVNMHKFETYYLYYLCVYIDNKFIAVIFPENTYMNSLTLKERAYVKSIVAPGILIDMYNKKAVVKGSELVVNINIGRNPEFERNIALEYTNNRGKTKKKLRFSNISHVQEITMRKNIKFYNNSNNAK